MAIRFQAPEGVQAYLEERAEALGATCHIGRVVAVGVDDAGRRTMLFSVGEKTYQLELPEWVAVNARDALSPGRSVALLAEGDLPNVELREIFVLQSARR